MTQMTSETTPLASTGHDPPSSHHPLPPDHHHNHHPPSHDHPPANGDEPPPYLYGTEAPTDSARIHQNNRPNQNNVNNDPWHLLQLERVIRIAFTGVVIVIFLTILHRIYSMSHDHFPYSLSISIQVSHRHHEEQHRPCHHVHQETKPTFPNDPSNLNKDPMGTKSLKTDPPRRYTRRETINPITGHFDLYDYLELTTVTSPIDIILTPHTGPNPAVLKIQSTTGPINIRLSDSFLADAQNQLINQDNTQPPTNKDAITRQVTTTIHSTAGPITATLILGNGGSTTITTKSGPQTLDFLAVNIGPKDPVTILSTTSSPGPQNIKIQPLTRVGGGKITNLRARHLANGFGGVDVVYPLNWEGRVDAQILGSGSGYVEGEDLVVDEDDGWRVQAHRGDGRGEVVRLDGRGGGSVTFSC